MKQAFGIFAALVLIPSLQVQAWVGGPWGNNAYQSNGDDGIYEAVGTMMDGTAMYRWAVHNENPGGVPMVGGQTNAAQTSNVQFGGLIGAQSPHVIWYRGIVYYGRCFGIVNSDKRIVMVTGNASDTGLNGTAGQLNGVDLNPGLVLAPAIDTTGGLIPSRKSIANSTWKAKLNKYYPMSRFQGHGKVTFIGAPSFDVVVINPQTTVTDTVVTTTVGGTVTTTTTRIVPSTVDRTKVDGSAADNPDITVRLKIFGNQVSTVVTS